MAMRINGINTSKIIKYNLEFLLTLSGQDIVHYH